MSSSKAITGDLQSPPRKHDNLDHRDGAGRSSLPLAISPALYSSKLFRK
jgi:hypothetical protein